MNETSTPPGWKAYGSIASFKVLVENSKFGLFVEAASFWSSLQPCRSAACNRSYPALFRVTPRCGSRCPSVIQLALVYPGTHPESCGAAPRLQGEAIDLPANENMVQDRLDLLLREVVLILRSLGNLGSFSLFRTCGLRARRRTFCHLRNARRLRGTGPLSGCSQTHPRTSGRSLAQSQRSRGADAAIAAKITQ